MRERSILRETAHYSKNLVFLILLLLCSQISFKRKHCKQILIQHTHVKQDHSCEKNVKEERAEYSVVVLLELYSIYSKI